MNSYILIIACNKLHYLLIWFYILQAFIIKFFHSISLQNMQNFNQFSTEFFLMGIVSFLNSLFPLKTNKWKRKGLRTRPQLYPLSFWKYNNTELLSHSKESRILRGHNLNTFYTNYCMNTD